MSSSTAITVQWGPVECRHQNGEIIGYSVRYGEEGSGSTVQNVSGDSSGGMTTISGLTKVTVYSVEVAAETSAGTGDYSQTHTIETPDGKCAFLTISVIDRAIDL